jgi:hypothetical protein
LEKKPSTKVPPKTNERTNRQTDERTEFFVFSLLLKQVKARRIQSQKRFTAERFGAPD